MKTNLKRRDFIKITAIAGGALLGGKLLLDYTSRGNIVVKESRFLMGTLINLTVMGTHPVHAREAIASCLNRMEDLENTLSRFKPDSQLSILNHVGVLKSVSPELLDLVKEARNVSELTEGAFDITVKPLVDLYRDTHHATDGIPEEEVIAAALDRVDYRKLILEGDVISFHSNEMGITLDGIAKGYIVDEGVAELRRHGFSSVLVEAGGDLVALGESGEGDPWRIGVQSPREIMGSSLTELLLQDRALATSGDYMQAYSADFSHHHILDPRTGYSTQNLASATVLHSSGAKADGLATALMVMEVEEGLALIEKLSGVDAFLVTKDQEILRSSGFVHSI